MRSDHHIAAAVWTVSICGCSVLTEEPAFLLLLAPIAFVYLVRYLR